MEQKVVKSAARAIQVLEYFDRVKRAASVAEAASHHHWPHSSTSILMRSLVALGYLHYDPIERTYMPSMRVALLGDWIPDTLFRNGQLTQLMEHLNFETGETIVLAAQNGLYAQYLRVIEGTNTLRMYLPIGTLRPLFGSGTGRMLLASMDDASIRKLLRKHNATSEVDQILESDALIAQIIEDRKRGCAVSVDKVTRQATLIAMLLPTGPTAKPLAIGVAGLTERLLANEHRYVDMMRESIRHFAGD
jgi:DNA-binding IclR family transcriptional regulator